MMKLIAGILIGIVIGIIFTALAASASRADNHMEDIMGERRDGGTS